MICIGNSGGQCDRRNYWLHKSVEVHVEEAESKGQAISLGDAMPACSSKSRRRRRGPGWCGAWAREGGR
jgi:hypothetical protein